MKSEKTMTVLKRMVFILAFALILLALALILLLSADFFRSLRLIGIRGNTINVRDFYAEDHYGFNEDTIKFEEIKLTDKQAKELKDILNSVPKELNAVWLYGETDIYLTDGLTRIGIGVDMWPDEEDRIAVSAGNKFSHGCGVVTGDDAVRLRSLITEASGIDYTRDTFNYLREMGIEENAVKFRHDGAFEGLWMKRGECDEILVLMKDALNKMLEDEYDGADVSADFNVEYDIHGYTVKLDTNSGITAVYEKNGNTAELAANGRIVEIYEKTDNMPDKEKIISAGEIPAENANRIFEILDKHIKAREK
ncbi:MAG: hypothetical protein IJ062_13645 [Firmicutes bacterium]|nr:hypothetical protein [Bacillota bacterium]